MNVPAAKIRKFSRLCGEAVIRVLCFVTRQAPDDWYEYHHKHCGVQYRGCHPDLCPKDQFENTNVWRFKIK